MFQGEFEAKARLNSSGVKKEDIDSPHQCGGNTIGRTGSYENVGGHGFIWEKC